MANKVYFRIQRSVKNNEKVNVFFRSKSKRFTKILAKHLKLCMKVLKLKISGTNSEFFSNTKPTEPKTFGKLTDTNKKKRKQVVYYPVIATGNVLKTKISFEKVDFAGVHFGPAGSTTTIRAKNGKYLVIPFDGYTRFVKKRMVQVEPSVSTKAIRKFIHKEFMISFNAAKKASMANEFNKTKGSK